MSGLGGDELFAGYPSYRELPMLARWLRPATVLPALGRAFRALSAPLLGRLTSPKYAGVFEYGGTLGGAYLLRRGLYMPWELERFFAGAFVRDGLEALDPVRAGDEMVRDVQSNRLRVTLLETSRYLRNQLLRDADWAGMAHSVEIRVPFVDGKLYRTLLPALAQANPPGKAEMARTLDVPLPESLLRRPKTGFSVPIRDWMQAKAPAAQLERGLRGWARAVCTGVRDKFRILAFVSDAFGGHGGIAKFNRDILTSLGSASFIKEVVAIPRVARFEENRIPPGVTWVKSALGGTANFLAAAARFGILGPKAHLIFCGHINLL
ncbi:MAG: asparagine synthase-related protein, partial [Acidobacteria bacterium]|nr:asparagine synthase-related protein [Acidobacteriota bacterium]